MCVESHHDNIIKTTPSDDSARNKLFSRFPGVRRRLHDGRYIIIIVIIVFNFLLLLKFFFIYVLIPIYSTRIFVRECYFEILCSEKKTPF